MSRPLRFCMITTYYPPCNFGGDGIFVQRLSNELARRGHHVQHLGGFQVGASTVVQQHLVKSWLEKYGKSFVAEIIYLPGSDSLIYAKQLLDVLRKNEVLCVSGDGKRGHKHVPEHFLGRAEHSPTGMMSLGKISGALLLPIFCIYTKDGATSLIIEPPVEFASSARRDELLQQALAQYLQLLESFIKRYPARTEAGMPWVKSRCTKFVVEQARGTTSNSSHNA